MNLLNFLRRMWAPPPTLLDRFSMALDWIRIHSRAGAGIAVTNLKREPYPEVSGYFIPTLMQWGEHDLASQYGRWLVSVQNYDGSWSDPAGQNPYTFDTGQILKGLLALVDRYPEFEGSLHLGCEWLLSRVEESGRVTTPDTSLWGGLAGYRKVIESIHLYALQPLAEVGQRWMRTSYTESVDRALDYYLADVRFLEFTTLSHFHAYVVEALIDLGRSAEAAEIMSQVSRLQLPNGAVPAYTDCSWVCSTGLFQYALIWYKLGDAERGDRAFHYACGLQNASGGFYGSYGKGADYFPREEISWAVKYFLDAFRWKIRSSFDNSKMLFPVAIGPHDGRYQLVAETVLEAGATRILDAGCGRGRFLRQLADSFPGVELTGLDQSEGMLESLPQGVTPLCGNLLDIPAGDETFDVVFCCEALEHVVNVPAAIRELKRVLRKGGALVIIDKDLKRLGRLVVEEWEQWLSVKDVTGILRECGFTVSVIPNLSYNDCDGSDGLFVGWIAR